MVIQSACFIALIVAGICAVIAAGFCLLALIGIEGCAETLTKTTKSTAVAR